MDLGRVLAKVWVQDLTEVGAGAEDRVITQNLGVAVRTTLCLPATHFENRRVHVNGHWLIPASSPEGQAHVRSVSATESSVKDTITRSERAAGVTPERNTSGSSMHFSMMASEYTGNEETEVVTGPVGGSPLATRTADVVLSDGDVTEIESWFASAAANN